MDLCYPPAGTTPGLFTLEDPPPPPEHLVSPASIMMSIMLNPIKLSLTLVEYH